MLGLTQTVVVCMDNDWYVLLLLRYRLRQWIIYYYSLDVSTILISLLFLFLFAISYLITAHVLYFIIVYPYNSVTFCGWQKILSNNLSIVISCFFYF